jgi:hypothetical protein
MSVPNIVTACRHGTRPAPSPQGWRVPRPRFAVIGLDSPTQRGFGKLLKAWWERHVPLATQAAPLADGAIRDLFRGVE